MVIYRLAFSAGAYRNLLNEFMCVALSPLNAALARPIPWIRDFSATNTFAIGENRSDIELQIDDTFCLLEFWANYGLEAQRAYKTTVSMLLKSTLNLLCFNAAGLIKNVGLEISRATKNWLGLIVVECDPAVGLEKVWFGDQWCPKHIKVYCFWMRPRSGL